MAIISFSVNTDSLQKSVFAKRNSLLLKFLTLDSISDQDITTLSNRFSDNTFLNILSYLSLFKIDRNVSFDEYLDYISNIINALANKCGYVFTNDIEKKSVIYSLIIKTSSNYTTDNILMSEDDINSFINIDLDNDINVWSMHTLGNLYLSIINPETNFETYLNLLNNIVSSEEHFNTILESIQQVDFNNLQKELGHYEI